MARARVGARTGLAEVVRLVPEAAQILRIYVRQFRHKIEPDPAQPQYILTETGIGYRLRGLD